MPKYYIEFFEAENPIVKSNSMLLSFRAEACAIYHLSFSCVKEALVKWRVVHEPLLTLHFSCLGIYCAIHLNTCVLCSDIVLLYVIFIMVITILTLCFVIGLFSSYQ